MNLMLNLSTGNDSTEQDERQDMEGKTILVTGATSGIGFYTARDLATKGARVIVTGRDEQRGREAVQSLRHHADSVGGDRIEFLSADHSTVGGNRSLAEQISGRVDRLDGLVNNVGGFYNDRVETGDGYEATLAMNLIGPFTLTEALLPLLERSGPARVVNVTSAAHAMWKGGPLEDIQSEESYLGLRAYARAKLLNLLWTFALARRLDNSGFVANATNPGTAWTSGTQGIARRGMPTVQRLLWPVFRRVQQSGSAEEAAHSTVFLMSSAEVAGVTGAYYESNAKAKRPSSLALDEHNQERAWDLATTLISRAPTASASGQQGGRQ